MCNNFTGNSIISTSLKNAFYDKKMKQIIRNGGCSLQVF